MVGKEVNIPLMISRVERNERQAKRVRGGRPRMATRTISVTMHKMGSSKTRGESANFAHRGTGGGSFGSRRGGLSGACGATSGNSPGPVTDFFAVVPGPPFSYEGLFFHYSLENL